MKPKTGGKPFLKRNAADGSEEKKGPVTGRIMGESQKTLRGKTLS